MKYIYTLMVMAFVSMAIISINPQTGHSNSTGAPAGNTGAAGETTCAQAGCHGGTAGTAAANAIATDIPAGGYVAGNTYNITITSAETGRPRFGFQAHATAGTFAASTETQLVGGGAYVTHKLASTQATDSKSWTFTWTAPAAGTGSVTFNAAVMAANGNGSSDAGDIVRKGSLTISEAGTNSVKNFDAAGMNIYPVPFTTSLTINKGTQNFESADVKVYTLDGKMVLNTVMTNDITLNTENLAKGIYVVSVNTGSTAVVQKVAKF